MRDGAPKTEVTILAAVIYTLAAVVAVLTLGLTASFAMKTAESLWAPVLLGCLLFTLTAPTLLYLGKANKARVVGVFVYGITYPVWLIPVVALFLPTGLLGANHAALTATVLALSTRSVLLGVRTMLGLAIGWSCVRLAMSGGPLASAMNSTFSYGVATSVWCAWVAGELAWWASMRRRAGLHTRQDATDPGDAGPETLRRAVGR